ncbi:MAG TPA: HD domain-containing phosphohydrolase [Candidatus Acidoferrales bacterium]|nr:HD domain-containing phosphohydrolase [Candidatus Acidoferrales bacterium]
MTLFQDTVGDPRTAAARLAGVLGLYGALGDAACGNPAGFAVRKAATAVSIASVAGVDGVDRDALYYAGLLHAVGALDNAAYRKGERLSERMARIEAWDVPAQGARVCLEIPALPAQTSDYVRWQSECWDGTGYPDQLRWAGIPSAAVILGLADTAVRCADPDEALAAIAFQAGRAFGPDSSRIFTTWFHTYGGEADPVDPPLEHLRADDVSTAALLDTIADRIDTHAGVAGRWRRIARLTEAAAEALALEAEERKALAIAVRTYGAGDIGERADGGETSFDPLARLGIDVRAAHGSAAAALLEGNGALGIAAAILGARGEWFDGTGKPNGLFKAAIPTGAAILAAAIASDALDHKDRIDTAGGTQFDPHVVRAILEAARTHA